MRCSGAQARSAALLGLAVAAGILMGCGQTSKPAGGTVGSPTARAITVEADPTGALRWARSEAQAGAGRVRITLRNPSPIAHDLHLTGDGVDASTRTVTQGSAAITVRVKPGRYEFRCDLPGHDAMTGTLVVR